MNEVPNAWIRELCGVTKELMKVFSDGSATWREGRMTGLPRASMQGSVLIVAQYVGHGIGGLIPWSV